MPGKGSRRTAALNVSNGSGATPNASGNADLSRATNLRRISESWVLSLKKFNGGQQGWIPDVIARRAAKPYGFLQVGIGN